MRNSNPNMCKTSKKSWSIIPKRKIHTLLKVSGGVTP